MFYVSELFVRFLTDREKTYAKVKDTSDNCVEVSSVAMLRKLHSVSIKGIDLKGCKRVSDEELLSAAKALATLQQNTDFVYDEDIPTKLTKCNSTNERIEVPYGITEIADETFSKLTCKEIVLPDTVTTIGNSAFKDCTQLQKINIPPNVLYIEEYTFSGCRALEKIVIPEGVIAIERRAFGGCSALKEIELPKYSLKEIGADAFSNCSCLRAIDLPVSLERLGRSLRDRPYDIGGVFKQCESLERVVIPPKITAVEMRMFQFCYKLKQVILPEGLTNIAADSFYECNMLESLDIPSTVIAIGDGAFSRCRSLCTINFADTNNDWNIGRKIFADSGLEAITFPKRFFSKVGSYRHDYTTVSMFEGCTQLKTINLPNIIKCWVGEHMFEGCTQLKELVIPEGVIGIDNGAFLGCTSLEVITIPASVTKINKKIFEGCDNLKKIRCYQNTAGAKRAKGMKTANKAIQIEYLG